MAEKRKWRTMYDRITDVPGTEPGDPVKKEYKLAYNEDGETYLKMIGSHSLQDEINSYAEGCDMSVILNKLNCGLIKAGLSEEDCIDVSQIPNSIAGAFGVYKDFKSEFDAIPDTLKEGYEDNPFGFFRDVLSGKLYTKPKTEPKAEPKAEPKVEPKVEPKKGEK